MSSKRSLTSDENERKKQKQEYEGFESVLDKLDASDESVVSRKPVQRHLLGTGDISFQQLDVCSDRWASSVRLFGVTMDGHSVLCHVRDFYPFFYARPCKEFKQEYVPFYCECWLSKRLMSFCQQHRYMEWFTLTLNQALGVKARVKNIEMVRKRSVMGYSPKDEETFLRITIEKPNQVYVYKDV